MKIRVSIMLGVILLLGWLIAGNDPGQAATQAEIEAAITKGVAWLAAEQGGDGGWGDGPRTCFALSVLQQRAGDLGFGTWDDPGYAYRDQVIDGWQYVFTPTRTVKVSPLPMQLAGDPDSNGNGYGVSFQEQTYYQGPCLQALADSGTPHRENDGGLDYDGDGSPDTFLELAQEGAEWLAFGQIDAGDGRGNWNYTPADNAAWAPDQSNSGFAVLGLIAAERLGATVPPFVRAELNHAINYIQCNPGDEGYNADRAGGAGYTAPCELPNVYKTGFLVLQMGFYGDDPGTSRFQHALDFIERHWRNTSSNVGWGYASPVSTYLGMYALMNGLTYNGIRLLDTDGDGARDDRWYNQEPPAAPPEDLASAIVERQEVDGRWPTCFWGGGPTLCTAWSLIVLQGDLAPSADLVISKELAFAPPAGPTGALTYTLGFFNGGVLTATDVIIGDAMPVACVANLSYAASSGVVVTDTGADPPYVWQVSDLAPGAGGVITVSGVLRPGLASGTVFTNTAIISTSTPDPAAYNNRAAVRAVLLPDLVIAKSVAPAAALPGDPVTYTVHFANTGTATASGVVLTDLVPISVTHNSLGYISSGPALTPRGGVSYAWDVADLDAGQGGEITITGRLSGTLAAGAFSNTATIAAPGMGGDPTKRSASADVTVQNAPPLAVDDTPSVVEDSADNPLQVLLNDADANGDYLTVHALGQPDQGGAARNDGAAILYTPRRDFFGAETFTYTVTDGGGGYATAWVTVTVTGINDAPFISRIADRFTPVSAPISVTFTISDLETAAEALGLQAASSNLALVDAVGLGGSGFERTLAITPTAGLTGTTTITITVDDGQDAAHESFVLAVGVDPPAYDVYLPLVAQGDLGFYAKFTRHLRPLYARRVRRMID